MWYCRKCQKPVYFAERKQSLGFDWHPNCLRCEECGKRLNPGQHAEHKGVPYCHHPCYGALFGPQLFGHGTRNECHTSFGKVENRNGQVKRSHLETCLKAYNQFYEGTPAEVKSKEVNGRLILEGVLRIYWGIDDIIHLKEEDDQRTISIRKVCCPNSSLAVDNDSDDEGSFLWRDDSPNCRSPGSISSNYGTTVYCFEQNGTMSSCNSFGQEVDKLKSDKADDGDVAHTECGTGRSSRTPKVILRRRPGRRMDKSKLKRRCSINGHFYLRETSSFTPPHGCACTIWVTSLVTATEVLNIVMNKYKVETSADQFALFVVKDCGERRKIKGTEFPLITRVMLGPHEDVARLFIMGIQTTQEISPEVAEFINLSLTECKAILLKYDEEEQHQIISIKEKYQDLKFLMRRRMSELKVL